LWLLGIPDSPDTFHLTRQIEGERAPLNLRGSDLHLFVRQTIQVEAGTCHTESYTYRLQADESPKSKSWLVRWEYYRKPPVPDYPYPLAHVHVRGRFTDSDEAIDRLHIPTGRVALELVIWHLIAEWGVPSKDDRWQFILGDSIKGFHERRTTDTGELPIGRDG
jgi:hypothetical protein